MWVKSMLEFVMLVTKKDMRMFLGTIGYNWKFIPRFTSYSSVLTLAVRKLALKKVTRWYSLFVSCVLCYVLLHDNHKALEVFRSSHILN